MNGIDTDSYNPGSDKNLTQTFTADTLEERPANKIAVQEEMGLEVNSGAFLLGMVTRLVEQKGLDLVIQILDRFMAYTDSQFILLGTGDRYYETQMWQLASRYSGRMAVYLLFNDSLARRIYAGSDAFLMPSRFEPCGISQMLSLRYGCVPIVRRTGGLVDTVFPTIRRIIQGLAIASIAMSHWIFIPAWFEPGKDFTLRITGRNFKSGNV